MPETASRHRVLVCSLVCLVLLFGAVFVVRGPMRGVSQSADLAHLYVASVLWLEGGNPYDGEQCVDRLRDAGHPTPQIVQYGSYYPPTSIAAFAPLGALSWPVARLVWLVVNMIACGGLIWGVSRWLAITDRVVRWLVALLLVLAWGPVATTLSLGQLSLVSAACAVVGLILLDRGRIGWAGILIGLGCVVKPQLGAGFLLLLALRKEWKTLLGGLGIVLILSLIGAGWLLLSVPDWFDRLVANFAASSLSGQAIDASIDAPYRHHMIDGRAVFHLFLPASAVSLGLFLTVGLLAGLAVWRLVGLGLRQCTLLAAAGIGLLMLLPVYHRYYDAVLLIPLLVLVTNVLMRNHRDWLMIVIALAVVPLFFPLPIVFAILQNWPGFPEGLSQLWLWRHGVMIHQSWCLLLAAVLLVYWTWRLPLSERSVIDA